MPWITSDELNFVQVGYTNATTSATTYETCTPVNLGMYDSVVFTVTQVATCTVTTSNLFVLECTATSALLASATTVIEGTKNYVYRTSSSNDLALATRTAGVTTAVVLSSTAGSVTVIEMKSADLTAGFPYVMLSVSSAAAGRWLSVMATMKPRYPEYTMLKAVASS